MNKKDTIIAIIIVLIVLGFLFLLLLSENKKGILPSPIEGYGIANGSCNNTGSIFIQSDSIHNQIKNIENNAGAKAKCFANKTSYSFSVKLPTDTYWCIDSSGFSGEVTYKIGKPICSG